jgi:hypothetical protein
MKTAVFLLITLFITRACDNSKSDISPSDQLYKRWKSIEIGKDGKDWRDITIPGNY